MEEAKRDIKSVFDNRLNELLRSKKENTQILTKGAYLNMIEKVKYSKTKRCSKLPEEYQRLRRYDVVSVNGIEKLIVPMKQDDNFVKYFVHTEEIFEILHDTHISLGHAGRNRMAEELKYKFKNITREMIALYLSLCFICQRRHGNSRRNLVLPVVYNEVSLGCRANQIERQSPADDGGSIISHEVNQKRDFINMQSQIDQDKSFIKEEIISTADVIDMQLQDIKPSISNEINSLPDPVYIQSQANAVLAIMDEVNSKCETELVTMKSEINVVSPLIMEEMNSRCQVDVIDMHSQRDGEYSYMLLYKDCRTKFVQLKPLRTRNVTEVVHLLLDIFTTFGVPNILQSDNGRDYANNIIQELYAMWDELKMVHGKTGYSLYQGLSERTTQEVQKILSRWLEANNTNKWSEGLKFVQFIKNREYDSGLNCSPYEAMFGLKLKFGLKASLPPETLLSINTEEDLELYLKSNVRKRYT